MKEYRVVCTRDEKHLYDGAERHFENTRPIHCNNATIKVFTKKADAEQWLRYVKERCAEFDKEHHKMAETGNPNVIDYWHSNFRIQSRTVTDWK